MKLGIFGQKERRTARWLKLGKDSFLFSQVLDLDRRMWGLVISFHLAGIALLIGHLRLIFGFIPLVNALDDWVEQFASFTGGAIGIILLITVLYFLIRRLKSPVRQISAPEDYFLLILVLLVIFTGDCVRFFGECLGIHVMLANILIFYFPFSKMMHFVGSFATNLIRSEYLWMSSYKRP